MAWFYFICMLILPLIQSVLRLDCVSKVTACPCKKEEWEKRSSVFNCIENLNYTCMLTSNETLVEACIYDYPVRPAATGCPEIITCYESIPITSVAAQYKPCNTNTSGCPPANHTGYSLTELYQFPECIQTNKSRRCDEKPSIHHIDEGSRVLGVSLGISSTLLLVMLSIIVVLYKRHRINYRKPNSDSESTRQSEEQSSLVQELESPVESTRNFHGAKPIATDNRDGVDATLEKLKEKYPNAQFNLYGKDNPSGKQLIIGYDAFLPRTDVINLQEEGIDVILKHPFSIRDEAVMGKNLREKSEDLTKSLNKELAGNKEEYQEIIQNCIKENAPNLWNNHSNLTIITGDSIKIVNQVYKPEACIVLYCLSKGFIPINEKTFPTELTCQMGTLKTDVREGYFRLGPTDLKGDCDLYNDPICMGSNIGMDNKYLSGSLGLFVNLPNNEKGFITCCHLFFDVNKLEDFSFQNESGNVTLNVRQPSLSTFCGKEREETICGVIERALFVTHSPVGIDAALVKVNARMPTTGHFVIRNIQQAMENGYTVDALPVFDTGEVRRIIDIPDLEKPLLKSGATTGLTRSFFRLKGAEVRICPDGVMINIINGSPLVLRGQYEVHSGDTGNPFFSLGDSGSAVFIKDPDGRLACIGIVVGITSYHTAIVTPIGAVLDALGLTDCDVTEFSGTFGEGEECKN